MTGGCPSAQQPFGGAAALEPDERRQWRIGMLKPPGPSASPPACGKDPGRVCPIMRPPLPRRALACSFPPASGRGDFFALALPCAVSKRCGPFGDVPAPMQMMMSPSAARSRRLWQTSSTSSTRVHHAVAVGAETFDQGVRVDTLDRFLAGRIDRVTNTTSASLNAFWNSSISDWRAGVAMGLHDRDDAAPTGAAVLAAGPRTTRLRERQPARPGSSVG